MSDEQPEEIGRHFEQLYAEASARDDPNAVPWARLGPNPLLVDWLQRRDSHGEGRPALVVGSGLGDDAEELARAGFRVTAIDISPSAVAWAGRRFPNSTVDYRVVDLFDPPADFSGAFALVFEAYTLQALPDEQRPRAMRALAGFVAPGGRLLIVQRRRRPGEPRPAHGPRGVLPQELDVLEGGGLTRLALDNLTVPHPGWPQLRAEYRRE